MKEVLPLNPDNSGLCRTLKAQYYKNGCANFLKTNGGSFAATGVIERDTQIKENHSEPLRIPQATKKGYIEVEPGSLFDMSYPESKTRRGRVQEGGKVSPTLMASGEAQCYYEGTAMTTGFHPNIQEPTFSIRKLTPRECFRLMGVTETDIDKIQQSGVSQSQQYKMAGNSIVVDVLEHIFRKMFVNTGQESQQLSLF